MALFQCQFFSETLEISASMNVILPQQKGKLFPTLYLLHGLSDDHTSWCRQTSIERYASAKGIAVVMPAVNRSFYTDMSHGAKYWTFVSEELPELARSFFPLSASREHNFAAGLSMGGYGAMKLGLSFPDRFAAVASLSGALDVNRLAVETFSNDIQHIFSDPSTIPGSSADLFALAERVAGSNSSPLLYQCCGTEDFLYEDNIRFREHCLKLELPLVYEEEPGDHEWGYWDRKIQRVLDWLPIEGI
ncbi:alpha/beta hydrolase [Cohnella silvisoli]|uniref:Alpha/beta hydrolase family protein n=1 Tax=Cohnella silvisoli TaxID=2873699 RepID=A0ABV1L375_9BACL|nr:alpha/beta hydrolase family protein [Cohnella silvisoli]MCD9025933.1 esterase family protein [Cohnella silvisoli]